MADNQPFVRVVVGSENPVKLKSVESAYREMLDSNAAFEATAVSSGVNDQPMSDQETLLGAFNRARASKSIVPDAQLWVGVEGGIQDTQDDMFAFAWIVVLSADVTGKSRSATFSIPHKMADLVRQGVELGEAADMVFGRNNAKQQEGAVGLLTDGVVDRFEIYFHAAKLAMIPFKQASS